MNHFKNMRWSLRTWLVVLSVLSMVPLLLVALYGMLLSRDQVQARLHADARAHAQELAHHLEQRIQMAASTLNALAVSDAAQRDDLKALYDDAKRVVASNPAFRAVTLVNRQEELVFVTSLPFGAPTFTPNHLHLVREVFESGRTNVSGPFVTPIRPDPLVAVSVPVKRDGRVVYCLRMVLPVASLSELLGGGLLPEKWIAVVSDREGNILARSTNAERFVGGRVAPEAYQALQRGEQGFYHLVTLDGVPSSALWQPVHGGDWQLGIAVPDSVLLEPAKVWLQYLLWGTLAAVLFAVALSQWMATYLVKQAQTMADTVAEEGGDYRLCVAEFWTIVQRFVQARLEEAQLGRELDEVSIQRDEVRDLYDNAPCGYHSLNAQGRVVEINQTELDWLGYTRDEVMGVPITDFFTEAGKATFQANYPRFKAQGEIHDLEFDLVRKDGSTFPVLISATAVKNDDGALVMSRSTVFDITERQAQEAALRQAHAELARERDLLEGRVHERTLELAKARDEAESSNRSKTALLANVSHELRTPLNHIIGHAYLLAQKAQNPEQRAGLETISQASNGLLSMVNNLIDVARLEGQTLTLQPQRFSLQAVLEGSVQQALVAATEKNIAVHCELDPAIPAVLVGDAHRITQVLQHLLNNAIKYSEQGRVVVRARQVAQLGQVATVRVAVEDQGIGISEELRARLFTLLEQGDGSATRRHGGTGLGLALCQRLVVLMGGRIGVEAVQPQGSCFWFELVLPVSEMPAEATPMADTPSAPAVEPAPTDAEVDAAAARMASLLADGDAEAVSFWETARVPLSARLQADAAAFGHAVEQFDFGQALALLQGR